METPILKLGPKQFVTGIAPGAHTETGGVFYKASGITPLYDAGGTASPENGLLQAGPSPTDFTGSAVVDAPLVGLSSPFAGAALVLYMMGGGGAASGHFYTKAVGAGAVTDVRADTQVPFPANGMAVWAPAGGTKKLYYWMQAKIGTWLGDGSSFATGTWSDTAYSITQGNNSTVNKPTRQFVGNVYYGNGDRIGALKDDGAGGVTHSSNVLDFPALCMTTGIADDGQYLVIATIENVSGTNAFARNVIYFWDTFSSSWQREYEIFDPFIWGLVKIGRNVYAIGQYGVYEISFIFGVQKLVSRLVGFGTPGDITSRGQNGNRAIPYSNSALMFATDSAINTLGKMQPDMPFAFMTPFKVPSGRVTFVSAALDSGRVYVGTNTPKLYAFDFNGATHDSGNTAQTVYFRLPTKMQINRIDLVFGEPLAAGDAISVDVYKDEDTASVPFGAATFAADGAIRRKVLTAGVEVDDQISLLLTFTSGAVKVKAVEVYGLPMTP